MSPLYIDESVQRVNSLICVLIAARRDDSHVDPAQLLDELIQLQGFAYSVRDSIMEAKEAALAEPEQIAAHGCHIDLEPGQSADACVFDDGRIEDCDYAWKLQREGKGKEACAEWRPIKLIKPTPRKPLTDEEIDAYTMAIRNAHPLIVTPFDVWCRHFSRAVIAAYEAKQGEQT